MMNRRRQTEFSRKQRTVDYLLPDRPNEVAAASPFYMHMFPQDVSLGILPIGGRTTRPDFKVLVSPDNKNAEEVIRQGLTGNEFNNSLADSLYHFFRPLATWLCVADRVTYEIVYLEDRKTNTLLGFELNPLAEKQVVERRGMLYQIVPREIAREKNVPELIPLEDDVIIFQPPVDFAKGLRSARESLAQLDKMQFPSIMLDATKNQNVPYDFAAHQRSMKLALVEAVKPVGWNARGSFNDCVMSYYWILMIITFEKFKIQLRKAMLASLNTGLRQVGKRLGFEAQIKVEGLPTIADVNAATVNLNSGSMAFTDVIKPFNLQ